TALCQTTCSDKAQYRGRTDIRIQRYKKEFRKRRLGSRLIPIEIVATRPVGNPHFPTSREIVFPAEPKKTFGFQGRISLLGLEPACEFTLSTSNSHGNFLRRLS